MEITSDTSGCGRCFAVMARGVCVRQRRTSISRAHLPGPVCSRPVPIDDFISQHERNGESMSPIWPIQSVVLPKRERIIYDFHAKRHVLAFQRDHQSMTLEGVRQVACEPANLAFRKTDVDAEGRERQIRQYSGDEMPCHMRKWVICTAEYKGEEIIKAAYAIGEKRSISLESFLAGCEDDCKFQDLADERSLIMQAAFTTDSSQSALEMTKDMLKRVLAIYMQAKDADHESAPVDVSEADLVTRLGSVCYEMGDYDEARAMFERALVVNQEFFGPDHVEVAKILTKLGTALGKVGEHEKKRQLLERALTINEKSFGPDHVEVAKTLDSLGMALGDLGDPKRQRQLLERALAIKERFFGPSHVEVARTLGNLGSAFCELGDHVGTRQVLERALAIEEKFYGPDHHEVAKTLTNLGNALGEAGDYAKKHLLLKRALAIEENFFGPDHVEVAITLGNLSLAFQQVGNLKHAGDLMERAAVIFIQSYGPGHPHSEQAVAILAEWGRRLPEV